MARIGNISIYASRKIDPNTILFHCNTDRIKVSEPTVKIKLDTERFSLNVEEYFKPSENSIAIQFFDLPETWDVDNLAEYYRKIRK